MRAIDLLQPFSGGGRHLVLSSEGISNYPAHGLKVFGTDLSSLGYEPSCLIFLRPQAEMIVASYLQKVKTNKISGTLQDYAAQQLTPEKMRARWNYQRRIDKLTVAFGNITVKWYPAVSRVGPNGVVDATFAWLGLRSPSNAAPDRAIINPTPGQEALIVLQSVNAKRLGGKRFADEFLRKAQSMGLLGSRLSLDRSILEMVHSATRESNARLLERYCPDLSAGAELELPPTPASEQPIEDDVVRKLTKVASSILLQDIDGNGKAGGGRGLGLETVTPVI
jgi:hypothetical protein